jgi:hypothetical protein
MFAACEDRTHEIDTEGSAAPIPAWSVPFTVRGRWNPLRELSYRCDGANGRVDPELFMRTIARALASWGRTGLVSFRPAREGESPDVVFSWAIGAHGSCRSFGVDFAVAHTGTVERGTFVHFDAGSEWSAEGERGESLLRVAAHEAGHVLGLDHAPDPASLMYPDTTVDAPTPADLAGLHSLYGGGEDGPGDLGIVIVASNEEPAPVVPFLRRVAPEQRTNFAVFDTDGNGSDDVVVWRTDAEGIGAVTIYHFKTGPELSRTIGPLLGVVPQGATTTFALDPEGRRWIVSQAPDGTSRVRRFDDRGWLHPGVPEELVGAPTSGSIQAALVTTDFLFDLAAVAEGDLDGDGREDIVYRELSVSAVRADGR